VGTGGDNHRVSEAQSESLSRFLTLADTATLLSISVNQAYALVRTGELPAIKVNTHGQWRVERAILEEYIAAKYEESRRLSLWNQSDFGSLIDGPFGAPHRAES
jgi:excisionase family DNA binding protein